MRKKQSNSDITEREIMEKFEIKVEISAKHVHLTPAHVEVLFGKGAKLTFKRELSQPGQFLSEQRVSIVGPKRTMENVAVLGPERSATQVEVSFTDARTIGAENVPIRESGDLKGSAPVKIVGPAGEIDLPEGMIVAKRHIHITPETAVKYGLKDKDLVTVQTSGDRALAFGETVVRVSNSFADSMHIDYNEANGAGLSGESTGIVTK
jgi:putative phosphotransacetylase